MKRIYLIYLKKSRKYILRQLSDKSDKSASIIIVSSAPKVRICIEGYKFIELTLIT